MVGGGPFFVFALQKAQPSLKLLAVTLLSLIAGRSLSEIGADPSALAGSLAQA